ncbi:MAG: hypothetical protein JKY82_13965 [Rhizobiaceae bacterium]|nr:hypothetical protein [Rhizobiaceae bacterium]
MKISTLIQPVLRTGIYSAMIVSMNSLPNILAFSHGESGGEGQTFNKSSSTSALKNSKPNSIVKRITDARALCSSLPSEYRADCLAQFLNDASKAASGPEYRSVKKTLKTASNKISKLVRSNQDKSAPKIRRNGKTYKAIKKSALPKVHKKAAKIVSETSTKLLRSASSSKSKKVHFAKIAKAVNSTKVLLRSA